MFESWLYIPFICLKPLLLRHIWKKILIFFWQSDELEHEKKRTDQYEAEMKKLRGRVEELKKKLCASEENVSKFFITTPYNRYFIM